VVMEHVKPLENLTVSRHKMRLMRSAKFPLAAQAPDTKACSINQNLVSKLS
jgi:hypothetical protein